MVRNNSKNNVTLLAKHALTHYSRSHSKSIFMKLAFCLVCIQITSKKTLSWEQVRLCQYSYNINLS